MATELPRSGIAKDDAGACPEDAEEYNDCGVGDAAHVVLKESDVESGGSENWPCW